MFSVLLTLCFIFKTFCYSKRYALNLFQYNVEDYQEVIAKHVFITIRNCNLAQKQQEILDF